MHIHNSVTTVDLCMHQHQYNHLLGTVYSLYISVVEVTAIHYHIHLHMISCIYIYIYIYLCKAKKKTAWKKCTSCIRWMLCALCASFPSMHIHSLFVALSVPSLFAFIHCQLKSIGYFCLSFFQYPSSMCCVLPLDRSPDTVNGRQFIFCAIVRTSN